MKRRHPFWRRFGWSPLFAGVLFGVVWYEAPFLGFPLLKTGLLSVMSIWFLVCIYNFLSGHKFLDSLYSDDEDKEPYCSDCETESPATIEESTIEESPVEESTIDHKMTGPKKWYETGWVWFWCVVVWPVGVWGLLSRLKPTTQWWVIGLGLLVSFGIIYLEDPNFLQNKTTVLTQESASSACYRNWLADDSLMSAGARWKNTWAIKSSETLWKAGVNYTINGYPAGYWCEVFVQNGEARIRITRYE